jgi:hypothetical protein
MAAEHIPWAGVIYLPYASTCILKAEQEESFSYLAHITHPKLCSGLHDTLSEGA